MTGARISSPKNSWHSRDESSLDLPADPHLPLRDTMIRAHGPLSPTSRSSEAMCLFLSGIGIVTKLLENDITL